MMSLQSMTGFARSRGQAGSAFVSWELRSLNGKGLEVRFRLPSGLERIEQASRALIQKRFARGNIQAALAVTQEGAQAQPVVNEQFLKELAGLAARLVTDFGAAPPAADGLLALRGVLETPDLLESEEEKAAFDKAVLSALSGALDQLEAARRTEGMALGAILAAHLDRMEKLVSKAEADPSREPAVIRARLAEQVRLLLDAAPGLDESRLAMEAALLATKADIREELDRLGAHIGTARSLLSGGGAVGRKLDFLSQEFNREANTICSKSNATSLTAIGLELKSVVDQFREQVQNLE